jgi:SOS response regulatory protein OraA/RecX
MSENTPLMKRAAALIARRAHSRGELRRKLAAAQKNDDTCNAGEIEAVLDRLEHLNLLNDAEYAYNFALYRIKDSGWGEEKVREALFDRNVAKAAADRALERVRAEIAPDGVEDALMEYVKNYCRKHGTPPTLKDAQKLARRLAGRGFDEGRIIGALQRIVSPEIFRCLETGE